MSAITGAYSKGIDGGFDEGERLQKGYVRPGIPWVDADENRKEEMRFTWIRRALETVIGNASPNNGFQCQGDGASNDFLIKGGDGTYNGAGRLWVAGINTFLVNDIRYVNTGSTEDELSVLPQVSFISGVGNVVLEDSSADYVVDSLIGRTITPDVTDPGTTANIVSNTARTITTDIDLVAAGVTTTSRYRVEMSTAVASRNDGVYINAFLQEVDGTELPSIQHDLGTLLTAQFFGQVRHTIEVHQGDTAGLPGDLSTYYVDADGFEHWRLKIADIQRFAGVLAIAAPDVTDLRITSANFSTFLRKTGDNMSGDLNMLPGANITLGPVGLVDGRDVSADGAVLDTIDWTAEGVAALLPKISWPVQAEFSLAAVTTQQSVVGQSFRTREPGGTTTVKGVITDAPDFRVEIRESGTKDQITAGTNNLEKVFGELTELHPTPLLTGTWTFTNASQTLAGVGGAALTELVPGDLILGPDSAWYTVDSTPSNNNVLLIEPFAGTTANVAGPSARRWLLDLFVNIGGTKTAYVPPSAIDFDYYFHEVFDAADRPVLNPFFTVETDQVAPKVPVGEEGVKGIVEFAPNLNTDALKAVQAVDTRLGRVQGLVGATAIDFKKTVELAASTGINVSIAESGDKMIFTITNTLPGGGVTSFPGFNGATGNINPDGVAALGGVGLAADGGHTHPLSSQYRTRTLFDVQNPLGASFDVAPSFTPRFAIYVGQALGVGISVGLAVGTASGDQAMVRFSGDSGNVSVFTPGIVAGDGGETWKVDSFTSASVLINRTGGATPHPGIMVLVVGDLLPA